MLFSRDRDPAKGEPPLKGDRSLSKGGHADRLSSSLEEAPHQELREESSLQGDDLVLPGGPPSQDEVAGEMRLVLMGNHNESSESRRV